MGIGPFVASAKLPTETSTLLPTDASVPPLGAPAGSFSRTLYLVGSKTPTGPLALQ